MDNRPVCPKCSGYGAFYSICDCGDGREGDAPARRPADKQTGFPWQGFFVGMFLAMLALGLLGYLK